MEVLFFFNKKEKSLILVWEVTELIFKGREYKISIFSKSAETIMIKLFSSVSL